MLDATSVCISHERKGLDLAEGLCACVVMGGWVGGC